MPSGSFVARRNGRIFVTGNSGFPKSHSIDKAIDKHLGAEREVIGRNPYFCEGRTADAGEFKQGGKNGSPHITAPATDEAKRFAGFGSALKPAWEPIILAMKPLDGTYANNALKWGVGGLNIDASRVGTESTLRTAGVSPSERSAYGNYRADKGNGREVFGSAQGRWPANLILDEEAGALLDEMSGTLTSGKPMNRVHTETKDRTVFAGGFGGDYQHSGYGDTGGASRFFYCAKASKRDRDEGLEGMPEREAHKMSGGVCIAEGRTAAKGKAVARNHHPTVKPTQLMRYLVRLVTPPNGTVLDHFCGSGSTGKAAVLEGFNFVGIDKEAEYLELACKRIEHAQAQPAPMAAQPALLEIA